MAEVFRVENLHVQYQTPTGQVRALNGFSSVQEQEQVLCLVGESGAGKSTLALAIMGLLPESATVVEGSIIFGGVDLLRASPEHLRSLRGQEMSLILQDVRAALNPVQSAGDQLQEVFLAHANPVSARGPPDGSGHSLGDGTA